MNGLLVAMAILGCSDDGSLCERVRVEEARYANVPACMAAQQAALQAATDLPYPSLMARCEPVAQTASIDTTAAPKLTEHAR